MSIYYQDELDRLCECGCGTPVIRRFVSGHNRRGAKTGDAHRARIAESQRKAWETKRVRMPLGSRRKDANGYWLVKVREGGGRWDKEHVLIAEQSIGRNLLPGEHVHHINCIRDDNRSENLVVLQAGVHTTAHHSLNALVEKLLADSVITFNRETGRYEHA